MLDISLTSDIMLNLNEMFGDHGRAARQNTMWRLLNARMAKETPVYDHLSQNDRMFEQIGGFGC